MAAIALLATLAAHASILDRGRRPRSAIPVALAAGIGAAALLYTRFALAPL